MSESFPSPVAPSEALLATIVTRAALTVAADPARSTKMILTGTPMASAAAVWVATRARSAARAAADAGSNRAMWYWMFERITPS